MPSVFGDEKMPPGLTENRPDSLASRSEMPSDTGFGLELEDILSGLRKLIPLLLLKTPKGMDKTLPTILALTSWISDKAKRGKERETKRFEEAQENFDVKQQVDALVGRGFSEEDALAKVRHGLDLPDLPEQLTPFEEAKQQADMAKWERERITHNVSTEEKKRKMEAEQRESAAEAQKQKGYEQVAQAYMKLFQPGDPAIAIIQGTLASKPEELLSNTFRDDIAEMAAPPDEGPTRSEQADILEEGRETPRTFAETLTVTEKGFFSDTVRRDTVRVGFDVQAAASVVGMADSLKAQNIFKRKVREIGGTVKESGHIVKIDKDKEEFPIHVDELNRLKKEAFAELLGAPKIKPPFSLKSVFGLQDSDLTGSLDSSNVGLPAEEEIPPEMAELAGDDLEMAMLIKKKRKEGFRYPPLKQAELEKDYPNYNWPDIWKAIGVGISADQY
jgi:hypothetical protein